MIDDEKKEEKIRKEKIAEKRAKKNLFLSIYHYEPSNINYKFNLST